MDNRNQMKELTTSKFFRTLQETSQSGIDKNADLLQNEYEDFADMIFSVGSNCEQCLQRERADNRVICHNMLVYTHVELNGLKRVSGKNPKTSSFYVEKAIELVNKQMDYIADIVDCPLRHKAIRLNWVGTLLDYVEWVYGLYEYLNQKGENVTIKSLFEVFNPVFGFKDFQYSSYFNTIKARSKGERTVLFDLQKKLLIKRMVKTDEKPSNK